MHLCNFYFAFMDRFANNLYESYNTVYCLNNNNTWFLCKENIVVIHFINYEIVMLHKKKIIHSVIQKLL